MVYARIWLGQCLQSDAQTTCTEHCLHCFAMRNESIRDAKIVLVEGKTTGRFAVKVTWWRVCRNAVHLNLCLSIGKSHCLNSDILIYNCIWKAFNSVGWEYIGLLCSANDTENGNLWEYPVLAKLPKAQRSSDGNVEFKYRDQEVSVSSDLEKDHAFLTGMYTRFCCYSEYWPYPKRSLCAFCFRELR